MNNKYTRVAIAGANGRMGRQLIKSILKTNNIKLCAALEKKNSLTLGNDVGILVGTEKTGVIIKSSLNLIGNDFDVFIDFTCPESTLEHIKFCLQHNKPMIIGTTGFSYKEKQIIHKASNNIAIVFSENFSISIAIISMLIKKITKIIDEKIDDEKINIEIVEIHHRHKMDSPSGTALSMGRIINNILGKNLKEYSSYCNKKNLEENISNSIRFTTIRAGDTIGEHTIMFISNGERIEITHKAYDRIIFTKGVIKSILWIKERRNGLFNMKDVLELDGL